MKEYIMPIIGISLVLFVMIVYAAQLFKRKFSRVVTVHAKVVNKQTVEHISKYSGTGKTVKYAVTFLADGKRLSFYVSEISYNGYRANETGILKYKGDRIIDFH